MERILLILESMSLSKLAIPINQSRVIKSSLTRTALNIQSRLDRFQSADWTPFVSPLANALTNGQIPKNRSNQARGN